MAIDFDPTPADQPMTQYSTLANETVGAEAARRKADIRGLENGGLAKVTMRGDGTIDASGHKDFILPLLKDAQEAPYLRQQLAQINSIMQQQLERVNRQEQFVSSHPILSVLAQVGSAAAQDRRMPPLTRALGEVAGTYYPTKQQTGSEKLGIVKEMLAATSQEERGQAAMQRAALAEQNLQLRGEYERVRTEIDEFKAKDEARHRAAVEAETARKNTILQNHYHAQESIATKTEALKERIVKLKEKTSGVKSPKEAQKLRGEVAKYEAELGGFRSAIVADEKDLETLDPESPAYASAMQARQGNQRSLADVAELLKDAKDDLAKVGKFEGEAPKYKTAAEARAHIKDRKELAQYLVDHPEIPLK